MATQELTNGGAPGGVKQTAQQIASQAKEKAQGATDRLGGVINEQVDTRSTQAADQISNVAEAIRKAGESAAEQTPAAGKAANAAADRLDLIGGYLQNSSGEQIVNDIQEFARKQPWVVAGAAAALGLMTARFLKASSDETSIPTSLEAAPRGANASTAAPKTTTA